LALSAVVSPFHAVNTTKGILVDIVESASPGIYLGWGPFVIQLGNLIVIAVMIALFVLALVLPFPKARRRR
jgi:large-conductance mechanosensitive channel